MTDTVIRNFLVLRHGKYSDGGTDPGLDDSGKKQAKYLAEFVHQIAPQPCDLSILSSSAKRAQMTAQIIGHTYSIEPVTDRVFWDDDDHSPNLEEGMRLILACTTPTVVVVAHADVTYDLPYIFGTKILKKTLELTTTRYGEGWHLTVPAGELAHIRQPT